MDSASCYLADVIETCGDLGLFAIDITVTAVSRSPSADRAIALQGQTMPSAGGDGYHVAQSGWYVGLAINILPPSDQRSVSAESQIMGSSRGDRGDIRQTGGDVRLPVVVAAPTLDGAVGLERQVVPASGGNCDDVRETAGNSCLAVVGVSSDARVVRAHAPSDDFSIRGEREA